MRAKWPFGLLPLIAVALLAGCPSGTPADPNIGTNTNDNSAGNNDDANDATGILVATPVGSEAISVDVYVAGTDDAVEIAKSSDQVIDLAAGTYRLHEYSHANLVLAPSVTVTAGAVTRVTLGAILVTTAAGSEAAIYDLYDASGDTLLDQVSDTDKIRPVPAGTYLLKEYSHDEFVFAQDVIVSEGVVTTVALGAILVTTAAGSEAAIYDLYDASGDTLLDQVNDTDKVRPVPAGTYLLKEYFHDQFVFAQDVVVTEGVVTTVALGAINLHSVDGADTAIYDIFAADGETLLDQVNDTNLSRPVPAGTYVLKEYFNDALVYAADVVVQAGTLTELSLGAIRYNGGESIYDIYDVSGEGLLDRVNDRAVIRSLPPGTYVLKPYFEDTVLAEDVVVVADSITDVP